MEEYIEQAKLLGTKTREAVKRGDDVVSIINDAYVVLLDKTLKAVSEEHLKALDAVLVETSKKITDAFFEAYNEGVVDGN